MMCVVLLFSFYAINDVQKFKDIYYQAEHLLGYLEDKHLFFEKILCFLKGRVLILIKF